MAKVYRLDPFKNIVNVGWGAVYLGGVQYFVWRKWNWVPGLPLNHGLPGDFYPVSTDFYQSVKNVPYNSIIQGEDIDSAGYFRWLVRDSLKAAITEFMTLDSVDIRYLWILINGMHLAESNDQPSWSNYFFVFSFAGLHYGVDDMNTDDWLPIYNPPPMP